MDKKDFQTILSNPFNLDDWRKLSSTVFNAKHFFAEPVQISLPTNNKATSAFELGAFNTSDDRIVGLYLVKLQPNVWIERNKVGLRELLRNIYKHDVDAALVVFEQDNKWRLSFVSEIRSIDQNGAISKSITEPKRYTYLLGVDEKTKTPAERLFNIAGNRLSLSDIRDAFSVESLNEEFYKVVAGHFYQLVGATHGKGTKSFANERLLSLPINDVNFSEEQKIYHEFAVRLIGRTVFCWFLKVKKSSVGIPLLPENLLSSEAVRQFPDYYHVILEKLFFQTLNTPIEQRPLGLPQGANQIPFLNGGLFEPQFDDFYKTTADKQNDQSVPFVPDVWFVNFFSNLEQYNFTIDENSIVDVEVSVDPEMLGRIFENLLAEIDPVSGQTARKATGSYYTPREIVDYMSTECLVGYLFNKTDIEKNRLRSIFKIDDKTDLSEFENIGVLVALDQLKILDPACGSGAFPIGILQKVVNALEKLDPNAAWWKDRQIAKVENPIIRKQIKERLDQTTVEYARKIGIIQNTLYGVDIQPIAAEISKLRCFLTLVVDEKIDDDKYNRGVEPLPNLEFKFVTANTLFKLPDEQGRIQLSNNKKKNSVELERELQDVRQEYLQCYGAEKAELKRKFLDLQKQLFDQQGLFGEIENSRAHKISTWNPFTHDKTDWFDPLWMYGVKDFDIVIGNPPYVSAMDLKKALPEESFKTLKQNFETAKGTVDLFIYFFEKGLKLLRPGGQLAYISPNRYLSASYGEGLRYYIYNNARITEIIDYSHVRVFKSASTYPVVTFLSLTSNLQESYQISIGKFNVKTDKIDYKSVTSDKLQLLDGYIWGHLLNDKLEITEKVVKVSEPLSNCAKINATSTASEADEYHYLINENQGFKLINTGTIDKYNSLWGKEFLVDKGERFLRPYLPKTPPLSKNRLSLYSSPKIILAKIAKTTEAFFDETGEYASVNTNCLHTFKKDYSPKYVLAWLNSKLFQYTFECFFEGLKMQGGYLLYSAPNLSKMYIKKADSETESAFNLIVDYLTFLCSHDRNEIDHLVLEKEHLLQLFQEVTDAMIYQHYFIENFKNAGIDFIAYVIRDFKPLADKDPEEKIASINGTYQILSEKDNEIRQNLKLMDTRLADLIMPIKSIR